MHLGVDNGHERDEEFKARKAHFLVGLLTDVMIFFYFSDSGFTVLFVSATRL